MPKLFHRTLVGALALAATMSVATLASAQPYYGAPPGWAGPHYYWHGRHFHHRVWGWDRFHHHRGWRYY